MLLSIKIIFNRGLKEITMKFKKIFLNYFCTNLAETLKKGKAIRLARGGPLSVWERASHTTRNPRINTAIEILASKALMFKLGKTLKEWGNDRNG